MTELLFKNRKNERKTGVFRVIVAFFKSNPYGLLRNDYDFIEKYSITIMVMISLYILIDFL
jgi:hypothetical protein